VGSGELPELLRSVRAPAPRRFGLGFSVTALAAIAALLWVAVGFLPRHAESPPSPAAVLAPSERAESVRAPLAALAPKPPAASVPTPPMAPIAVAPTAVVPARSTETAATGGPEQAPVSKHGFTVRVTADLANLRAGPGTKYAVIGQTRRGDVLNLLERQTRWLHVRQGALDAWLYATLAEDVELFGLKRGNDPKIVPLPDVRPTPDTEAPAASPDSPPAAAPASSEQRVGPASGANSDISSYPEGPKTVYVHGYYRKDGTYVHGYYRRPPRKR
jgi:Bacterial SH3 domain